MSAAAPKTFDELYALDEMDAFLKKAQEKCRIKVAHKRFAGMETEDVVQEVLIKVYRSMERYDGEVARVATYVDHVMDNMIRDCLRKAGSGANLAVVNAFEIETGTDADRKAEREAGQASCTFALGVPDYGYENVEFLTDMLEHLQLTAQEREVFRLRLAGFDFTEVAEKLGVSKARVSQVWKRIKDKYMAT